MSELEQWDSFYVIVGSAAGALIGLQFVVMTLIAERPPSVAAGAAFATPTITHFSTALFLAALLRVPWHRIMIAAVLWGLLGLVGTVYAVVIVRRMRAQHTYEPEFEDWLFHALLPLASYVMLVISAFTAPFYLYDALLGVGAAVLLLLFIGIHNAWDNTIYQVFVKRKQEIDAERPARQPDQDSDGGKT
ncbi:MAG: hypothetical protein ACM3VT_07915 [Solirubrobacterales bacterium]|jgi:zinc transporter ZupT